MWVILPLSQLTMISTTEWHLFAFTKGLKDSNNHGHKAVI
jgi:hypothetical protein